MAKFFIISGPSAVGKDSVVEGLKKEVKFTRVITTTTREPRQGEENNVHYRFTSKKNFEDMIRKNKMIEYAKVYDNYYGQEKSQLDKALKGKTPVLMVIDQQGALTYKKLYSELKVIFLIPPSLKILEKRMRERKKDSEEVIKRRLSESRNELKNLKKWDYLVKNKENKLEEAIEQVKKIITSLE
jgi:guanylate kinase